MGDNIHVIYIYVEYYWAIAWVKAPGSASQPDRNKYIEIRVSRIVEARAKNFNLFYPQPFGFAERNRKRTSLVTASAASAASRLSDGHWSIERTGLKRV